MIGQSTVANDLANDIVNRVENLLVQVEAMSQPLELEPFRSQLFELFVTAEAAGFVQEDTEPNLSADGIARQLAQRWDLSTATQRSFDSQDKLPPEQLSRLRMLWSCMRMWIEWSYAWQRWAEFHS